ncbi:8-amino-7-oxononanoate synthase [Thermochromatium tepidum]|uniref:8-amino-7-oxononanoate synthase n=1 Tax=Thermochromatium tepidum ATCC 43061 TaxID=316276 RepID=A0A6I6EBK1_THETI|nr:8-amino-7-oxononanoate synthase [Thermochromatium tepidum]QGU32319.1 8-amino-7-oxononanoate synthase [Thermochromatium tepidum ATCC 43061]
MEQTPSSHPSPETELRLRLEALQAQSLYRRRRLRDGPQQPRMGIDGRPMLSFCSNDYLGLANHPEVIAALCDGARRWGVGSGAAHLVNGHSRSHQALEESLAEFSGRPRALLFSTGYMANLGIISALAGRNDWVFEDRFNHASLLDGALLSRARLCRYPHADTQALQRLIASTPARLIVTDGVFSMDGDLAPLPELAAIARASGAWLMVDDAHGLGVLGPEGRGTLEHFGLGPKEVPILMGTLGKAFGTFGAFVAGPEELIETLIQSARSYLYTTATPPALAEATLASLAIARREHWRRERLAEWIERFRTGAARLGLNLMDSPTPIQPLLAGSAEQALAWSAALESEGLLVTAIRPPTVPAGTARLRITLSATHSAEDIDRLLAALARLPLAEPTPSRP